MKRILDKYWKCPPIILLRIAGGCLLLGWLFAACVSLPEHQDPLAGLRPDASSQNTFKNLTVGIILSENSKKTAEYMERWQKTFRVPVNIEAIFGEVIAALQRNFKSAVRIDKIEDAGAAHTDMTAVLDITAKMPGSIFEENWFNASVVLLAPDQTQIDTVTGRVDTFIVPDGTREMDGLRKGAAEASRKLENALLSSKKAAAFVLAKSNASKAAIAQTAVPQAAPEPKVISSDVDELPAIKAKPNKNSYAIVIGIEQYRQKLPKADFATQDAKTVTEYLTKVMGYPEENVVTLINDRALKSDMEKYFEKWLWNNVEKDGSVFIYYSGHGAPNPKTGDAYLVPYDGDPSFIDQTGYSLKRLYDNLGKLQAKEIIVALDSCFSGAGGRSVIAKGARPLVMTMESLAIPSKVAVLSASSGEQISSTYEEKGHGLFTYFMLKGIKGEGDTNGDGKVEIGELFEYIKPQVERIARKTYNNEQSPQLIAPLEKQKMFLIEKGR